MIIITKIRFPHDLFDDVNKKGNQIFRNIFLRSNMMRTDIREDDERYYLDVELPGYNKDEIKLSFENGTLTIEAAKENADDGRYISRERLQKARIRTFYIGNIDEKELNAAYHNNGILCVSYPKKTKSKKNIEIE